MALQDFQWGQNYLPSVNGGQNTIVECISNFVQLHYLICLVGGSELAKKRNISNKNGDERFYNEQLSYRETPMHP